MRPGELAPISRTSGDPARKVAPFCRGEPFLRMRTGTRGVGRGELDMALLSGRSRTARHRLSP